MNTLFILALPITYLIIFLVFLRLSYLASIALKIYITKHSYLNKKRINKD